VDGLERQRSVNQQHGHQMLEVEVGHRRVVDGTGGSPRQMHFDGFNIAWSDSIAFHQLDQSIERGLRRGDALPLIGKIILLHARQRAGRGVARVVKRVRGVHLVGDILIVLRGDHGRLAGGNAATIGHLVGAA